jgi:hypothetical protein
VHDAPVGSCLSNSRWGSIRRSCRPRWRLCAESWHPVGFYSWFACGGQIALRGVGVSLSSTPLLADASLPSSTTFVAVYAFLVPP